MICIGVYHLSTEIWDFFDRLNAISGFMKKTEDLSFTSSRQNESLRHFQALICPICPAAERMLCNVDCWWYSVSSLLNLAWCFISVGEAWFKSQYVATPWWNPLCFPKPPIWAWRYFVMGSAGRSKADEKRDTVALISTSEFSSSGQNLQLGIAISVIWIQLWGPTLMASLATNLWSCLANTSRHSIPVFCAAHPTDGEKECLCCSACIFLDHSALAWIFQQGCCAWALFFLSVPWCLSGTCQIPFESLLKHIFTC